MSWNILPDTDILHELVAEVRSLRRAIEALPHGQPCAPGAVVHSEALTVLAAAVGARLFSVSELLAHATLPEGAALRAALLALAGDLNARKIGQTLRRLEGQAIGSLRIERVGVDRLGAIWCLRVV